MLELILIIIYGVVIFALAVENSKRGDQIALLEGKNRILQVENTSLRKQLNETNLKQGLPIIGTTFSAYPYAYTSMTQYDGE